MTGDSGPLVDTQAAILAAGVSKRTLHRRVGRRGTQARRPGPKRPHPLPAQRRPRDTPQHQWTNTGHQWHT